VRIPNPRLRRLALIAALAAGIGAAAWLGAFDGDAVATIRGKVAYWRAAADTRPVAAVLAFAAVYVAVTALSLPIAAWLSLLAGALFGPWVSIPLVSVSATAGATLAMLSARYVLRDWVRARFGPRLEGIDRGLARDGAFYLAALRLVPLLPFWLVNLAAGVTALPVRQFVVGSWVGMLPATAVYVNAGWELGSVESPADILTGRVLGAFALLAILPLVARFVVRRFSGGPPPAAA